MDAQAWRNRRRVVAAVLIVGAPALFVLVGFAVAGQIPLSAAYLAGCILSLFWTAHQYMEARSKMPSARGVSLGQILGPLAVALGMGVMAVLWAAAGH